MFHVTDQRLKQIFHSNGVQSRHDYLVVRQLGVDIVGRDSCHPRLPFSELLVPVPVVDSLLLREVDTNDFDLIAHPLVEALSSKLCSSGTE